MAGKFRVTFEIVTPESAAMGDIVASGYCSPGGWQHDDPADLTLREAITAARCNYSRSYGAGFEDCGRWFTTVDPDLNYRTGEDTQYAIHPPCTITAASYRRVKRILTGRT